MRRDMSVTVLDMYMYICNARLVTHGTETVAFQLLQHFSFLQVTAHDRVSTCLHVLVMMVVQAAFFQTDAHMCSTPYNMGASTLSMYCYSPHAVGQIEGNLRKTA